LKAAAQSKSGGGIGGVVKVLVSKLLYIHSCNLYRFSPVAVASILSLVCMVLELNS
jgi:hypothetical protein